MNSDEPWDTTLVFVLKDGRQLGPFTISDLLDGLETGEFSPTDICLREGAAECERLRDILDWDEEPESEEEDEAESSPLRDPQESIPEPSLKKPRERLIYKGHPSILTFPLSVLVLLIGAIGGVWSYQIDFKLTMLGYSLALAALIRITWIRYSHDYRIRTRRIELVTGFLARSSKELRISDIRSINVTCRGLIGILGVGTVDFLTSGDEPEITFRNIWAAQRVKTAVRRLQDEGS